MKTTDNERAEELRSYRALKRFFHYPNISNEVARRFLQGYARKYPDGENLGSLKRKFFWHRVLRGYRYRGVQTEIIGQDKVENRLREVSSKGSDKKDVLLVSHEMSLTGAPRALLNMAKVLKANGFNPYIFALRGGPLCDEADKAGISVVADLERMLALWYLEDKGDGKLVEFFRSFPMVMLNTMESITMFPLSLIKESRKLGWIHESARSYENMDRYDFENLIAQYDDLYIVGDHARKNAMRLTSKASGFKNLYYGVDPIDLTAVSKARFTDGKIHLLLAGTIEERKGHHILGEALTLLGNEEREQLVIHCAGSVVEKEFGDRLKEKGGETVVFEGSMPHDSLIELLEKCDGLICPSLDDPMPIVCTEAFQMQKPVLVADTTGTASFIEDGVNGFLVKGGNAPDLARGLRAMIGKRSEFGQIGRAGEKIYSDNFSLDSFAKSILSIFSPTQQKD